MYMSPLILEQFLSGGAPSTRVLRCGLPPTGQDLSGAEIDLCVPGRLEA